MWKQLMEFGNKLFALMRRTQKLEEENKELRQELKDTQQEVKELNQKVVQLTHMVQSLAFEFQHDRENHAAERKIRLLEIDNRFLRFERRLPPGKQQDETQE